MLRRIATASLAAVALALAVPAVASAHSSGNVNNTSTTQNVYNVGSGSVVADANTYADTWQNTDTVVAPWWLL